MHIINENVPLIIATDPGSKVIIAFSSQGKKDLWDYEVKFNPDYSQTKI